MRRIFKGLVGILAAVFFLLPLTAGAEGPDRVYVLHVDGMQTIDPGLAQLTRRAFAEAEADPDAVAVAILVNTPGGMVESAMAMKEEIFATHLKTVAFVNDNALSAGALIATAAEYLYMAPGSQIGAAEPRELGSTEAADYKTVASVVGAFRSAAEGRGRDPDLAQAMVDVNAKVPGQTTELLVLTAQKAVETGYANGTAKDLPDALRQAGISDFTLVHVTASTSEQIGRFLTTPWVAILLLVVGVIALSLEFMKPGITIPGVIGIIALGLFFLGNALMGTAGWVELALALIGVVLMVIEIFVPGFGLFGIGGVVLVAISIFMAVPTPRLAVTYLFWTALAFTVGLFGIMRTISKRGLGRLLTLERSGKDWVPARVDLSSLIGQEGRSLTVLRPAGTAQFGDLKVDVVTEGEYLGAGVAVKVIRVEGTRVVVRAVD